MKASFWDVDEQLMRGDLLFVQCFTFAPNGDLVRIQMPDDGIRPDNEASDGVYRPVGSTSGVESCLVYGPTS